MTWKKWLMLIVAVGALGCFVAACWRGDYVTGVLAALTALLPVVIWFFDNSENLKRDERLRHHETELENKADADQGTY